MQKEPAACLYATVAVFVGHVWTGLKVHTEPATVPCCMHLPSINMRCNPTCNTTHRETWIQFAATQGSGSAPYVRFCNMLITDATYLLVRQLPFCLA